MGLGAGYGHATSSGTLDGDAVTYTYNGGGSAYEILIGGTVGHAWVIGGGFVGQDVWDPKIHVTSTNAVLGSYDLSSNKWLGIGAIGPFVDWFPNETGGFHAGAMIGLGIIGLDGDTSFGGSLWAGYDFWIAKQWSLGAELRAAGAKGSRDTPGGSPQILTGGTGSLSVSNENTRFDDSAETIELLFTALLH
jgi:hypothetical protein